MKKKDAYYLIMHDSNRDDLETVDKYKMGDFRLTVFWKGTRFEGTIPDSVKITLDAGHPSDYLGNPMSWEIISPDFLNLIRPFIDDNIQLIPLIMYKDGEKIDRYTLINPLGCVNAVVDIGKDSIPISQMKLDSKAIPPGRHIFRLCHSTTLIVVSQAFVDAIWGHGLKGIALKRLPLV